MRGRGLAIVRARGADLRQFGLMFDVGRRRGGEGIGQRRIVGRKRSGEIGIAEAGQVRQIGSGRQIRKLSARIRVRERIGDGKFQTVVEAAEVGQSVWRRRWIGKAAIPIRVKGIEKVGARLDRQIGQVTGCGKSIVRMVRTKRGRLISGAEGIGVTSQ